MRFLAEITVTLKDKIKDPQGLAVDNILKRMNVEENSNVNVGKFFTLTVSAENEIEANSKINSICKDILSNPVLENYKILRIEQQ